MSQRGNVNGVGWPGGDRGQYHMAKCDHKGMSTSVAMPSDFLRSPDLYIISHTYTHTPDF